MKTLLLTSAGTDVKEEILKILPKPAHKLKLAYIITASKVESDTSYVQKDGKNLEEMGFQVEEIDIEGKNEEELRSELSKFDIIFVQGGNTFYLLKTIKESGFDKVIKDLINEGKIYIGVSAGTIICSPTIESSGWKGGDRNTVGLTDLTSLGSVPFNIFVHYEPKYDQIIKAGASKSKYPTRILNNNQAFLVQGDKITLVGEQPEIVLK